MKGLIVLLVLATLPIGVAAGASALWGDPDQLEAQRDEALRSRLLVEQRLAELQADTQIYVLSADSYWTSGSPRDLLSALQAQVRQISERAGLEIRSLSAEPERVNGSYRTLGLRIESEASYEAVLKMVSGIETTTPALNLEALQIRHLPVRPGTDGPPAYYITATISALTRVEG